MGALEVETMEHLLYGCENYSAKIWALAGRVLTLSLSRHSGDFIPRIDLTPLEIVFNKPHPSILLHVPDGSTRKVLILFLNKSRETSSSAELSSLSLDVERNFNPEFKHIFCQWFPSCKPFWNTKESWTTPTRLRSFGAWHTPHSMIRLIPHTFFLHSIFLISSPLIAKHPSFIHNTFPYILCVCMVKNPKININK